MLNGGLSAFSDAIHSLCDMHDISHACLLLHHASNLVDAFEPSSTSEAQFLLAKSHYLLLAGKVRLNQLEHLNCFKQHGQIISNSRVYLGV